VSEENVEIVKRGFDAFNRGDLDALLADWDVNLEWRPAFGGAMLGAASYRGDAGYREWWRDVQGTWDQTFRFTPETFSYNGNAVVVIGRGEGRMKGVEMSQRLAALFRFRGGKIVFAQTYSDAADALRAAGLEE
jgi:uncharacterized protein